MTDVSKNTSLNLLMDRTKPLTAAMDNVLAAELGRACKLAAAHDCGDFIDRGLVLRRLLDEAGFELRLKPAG